MGQAMWTPDFEPTRRQRGGRGHGRRGGHGYGGPGAAPGEARWAARRPGSRRCSAPTSRAARVAAAAGAREYDAVTSGRPSSTYCTARPEPVNGYQVIQQIAERTDGVWKPSPGSVYPTIAQLQDEGLVEDAPTGRKAVQLTAEGTDYVEGHAEEMAAVWAPFAEEDEDVEAVNFKQVVGQTVGAIVQVMSTGTPDQRAKAHGDPRGHAAPDLRPAGRRSPGHRRGIPRGRVMDALRISDADRASALDLLSEQYAQSAGSTRTSSTSAATRSGRRRPRATWPRSSPTCRAARRPCLIAGRARAAGGDRNGGHGGSRRWSR